jgi:hypothetical protein
MKVDVVKPMSRRHRIRDAAITVAEMLEGRTFLSNVPFVAQTALTTSAMHAHSTVLFDVDRDNDLDVVTASQTDQTVAWFENIGGSFTEHIVSTSQPGARTAYAVDLDGDTDIDLLSAAEQGNVVWYENNGSQVFTAHNIITGNPGANDVSVADLNGDEKLDVIADDQSTDSLIWYENNGSQAFTPHTIANTAGTIKDTDPIDLDGDGDIDIVTAAQTGNRIVWFENNGNSTFTGHTIDASATGSFSAVAGDIDGDGDIDIAAASNGANSIQWYENNGNQGFTKHTLTTASQGAIRVFIADIDSDGDTDILSCDFGDDKVQWFENIGDGSFAAPHVIATGVNQATDVAAGDLDGDGDLDVTSASFQDNTIRWYQNTGGRLQLDAVSTAPSAIGNSDFDDLLKLTATHVGRSGDNPDRLATVGVKFLSATSSTALSTPQASALIGTLSLYRDSNANGAFDNSDLLVATTSSLSLSGTGVQTLSLSSGDSNANFGPGSPATFFVAVTMKADASSQAVNSFRVASASGTAADRTTSRVLVNATSTAATTTAVLATAVSPPPGPPPSPPPSPPPPPPGTGTLTAVAEGTLPPIAVSGERAKASVRLTVSNPSVDLFNGRVTINLFASTDTTLDGGDLLALNTSKKLKIKGSREKAIKLKLRGFPAGLSDGVYHLLAQIVPEQGTATVIATDATSTVQAPFFNLNGTVASPPATLQIGKKSSMKVLISNTGNVLLNNTVLVTVRALPTIVTDVLNELGSIQVRLKLKPNHPKKVTLKFLTPLNLPAGTYTLEAVLDSTSLVPESNEGDNLATSPTPTTVA